MSGLLSSVVSSVSALANQPAPVVLGSLTFAGAEVPSRITIGGKQLAAIHKLPGGARVIDAMGPDDSAIIWQGIFIGSTAASRVRMVDALRTGGQSCTLAFGDYSFEVIVVDFQYSYESRGAVISYRLHAEKTQTVVATIAPTALESALTDCSAAAELLTDTTTSIAAYGGVSASPTSILASVLSSVGLAGATLAVSDSSSVQGLSASALSSPTVAIQDAISQLSVGSLASGVSGFTVASGSALISAVQNAGALAALVGAGGLINRANVNLATADAETASIGVHS